MEPNHQESLNFLMILYPKGPWMLTAISSDKKSIEARTFEPNEREEVTDWLALHKKKNLYYSVNLPIQEAREKRKLSKLDIASAHYLHVDVDPRAGEDLETEQKRILKEINDYKITPTFVIFSGGGYNALWKLSESFHIADGSASEDETIARAVDFERRNWQLELDFNTPDHCRDVSRILRLPGTINWPNKEKIEKGRHKALAAIIQYQAYEYPLEGFMATPHVSSNASKSGTKVTENIERIESLDQLKNVPDKLKVIIAQGFDPEEPRKWEGDRSAALYFVCCELVRCGIPDSILLGIVTDSRFLISASVLDKGSGVMRYAMRQVQRARDNADNPLLARMNEEFAVILSYGNETVVMVEKGKLNNYTKTYEPVFQKFHAFKDRIKRYPKITIELPTGKEKVVSAFEWWTSHQRRREYEDITFEPGLDTPNRYNFWTGFSAPIISGDKHERYLSHVYENICSAHDENYNYLISWMARVVQQPRTRSLVAPVLLGDRGTGKSIFCDFFGSLFEPHRYTASDITELTGKFNAHLGQCLFVVAEEAFDLRDKRHESVLKERITGRTVGIERKGVDKIQMPNYVHLIMTSNNERVVPAGDHERRFFVLRVGNAKRQDSDYFKKILADQENGGVSNLLHYLMSLDISEFDVTRVPQTAELREQQEHNLAMENEWLLEKLETGEWLPGQKWSPYVKKKALYEDYKNYLTSINVRYIKGVRAFHRFIMKEVPGTTDKHLADDDRSLVFIFPPLEECRAAFDRSRGWTTNWAEVKREQKLKRVFE